MSGRGGEERGRSGSGRAGSTFRAALSKPDSLPRIRLSSPTTVAMFTVRKAPSASASGIPRAMAISVLSALRRKVRTRWSLFRAERGQGESWKARDLGFGDGEAVEAPLRRQQQRTRHPGRRSAFRR